MQLTAGSIGEAIGMLTGYGLGRLGPKRRSRLALDVLSQLNQVAPIQCRVLSSSKAEGVESVLIVHQSA